MSYELYEPNPYHAPAPPPPPPRRSASGWIALGIVAALAVPVLIVLGCGFGGILLAAKSGASPSPSASTTRETVQPAGGPYRFQLPAGYVPIDAPADARGTLEHATAAALAPGDTANILLAGSATLPVDTGTLAEDALRTEVDATVAALGHDARTGQATSVHGYSAYRYDFVYGSAHADSYFVFKGTTMVQVLCRWADQKDAVRRGCDDLLATLTIT
ncbi:hypothetical protein [Cryptosporangium japonicum]|uniref:Lipoprotein LpqN n=1 Tax=Cryptosporangium japonicum TaxID=80872 RepID=A0ABN0TPH0_9ACTN